MLGFMITTAFLSMWISNTATTAMMIPIVEAVIRTIDDVEKRRSRNEEEMMSDLSKEAAREDGDDDPSTLSPASVNRRKMLLLAVAYAANIGGTGVITGSPPNLVLPAVRKCHRVTIK